MPKRISFDISDKAEAALIERANGVDLNTLIKETVYAIVDVPVEPNAATRRRIENLANREAKIRAERERLDAMREAQNSLI